MDFLLKNVKASREKNIVRLTRSVKDKPQTEFCRGLEQYGIMGVDFDAIKLDFCVSRKRGQVPFCSVDCFIEAKGKYYFIEFKNATTWGLNGLEIHEGEPIDVSLRKKAFDSMALAPLTVLQHDSGEQIMRKAEYIVVRLADVDDAPSRHAIEDELNRLADRMDSVFPDCAIQWDIEKLKELGLFSDVHTWPESKFVDWAKKNLMPA